MCSTSPGTAVTTRDVSPSDPTKLTPASQDLLTHINSSPYINIYGDLMFGLACGYPGGSYAAKSSADWFWQDGSPLTLAPFAGARPSQDDGFYSRWAAVVYNDSEAYGHPYADRGGRPNPTMTVPCFDVVRATILSDTHLDAPQVTAIPASTTIALSWPPVPGATRYEVRTSPSDPAWSTQVVGTSYTLGDTSADPQTLVLTPGTPYTVTVRALDGARSSAGQPVDTLTTEALQPLSNTGSNPFQLYQSINIAALPVGLDVYVNGTLLTRSQDASGNLSFTSNGSPNIPITGALGYNRYVLSIVPTGYNPTTSAPQPAADAMYTTCFSVPLVASTQPTLPTGFSFFNVPPQCTWFDLSARAYLDRGLQDQGGLKAALPAYQATSFPLPPFSWPPATLQVDPEPASGPARTDTTMIVGTSFMARPSKAPHPVKADP